MWQQEQLCHSKSFALSFSSHFLHFWTCISVFFLLGETYLLDWGRFFLSMRGCDFSTLWSSLCGFDCCLTRFTYSCSLQTSYRSSIKSEVKVACCCSSAFSGPIFAAPSYRSKCSTLPIKSALSATISAISGLSSSSSAPSWYKAPSSSLSCSSYSLSARS